jgi:hypothetical protein
MSICKIGNFVDKNIKLFLENSEHLKEFLKRKLVIFFKMSMNLSNYKCHDKLTFMTCHIFEQGRASLVARIRKLPTSDTEPQPQKNQKNRKKYDDETRRFFIVKPGKI